MYFCTDVSYNFVFKIPSVLKVLPEIVTEPDISRREEKGREGGERGRGGWRREGTVKEGKEKGR